MTLGERLLILRRRCGLSQGRLAAATGLHKNTIARVEQGDIQDITGETIIKLVRALGCSSDQLLGLASIDAQEEQATFKH
jgi:transcriptional regulator with XRE-family HTH domain